MIDDAPWTFDEATGKWGTTVGRRRLAIGWDDGDHALYLSVVVEPEPNVPAQQVRMYAAPIPLLAALSILPKDEHPRLVATTRFALNERRDAGVVAELPTVVGESAEAWPKPQRAAQAMKRAAEVMPVVERLALDMAAASAWTD